MNPVLNFNLKLLFFSAGKVRIKSCWTDFLSNKSQKSVKVEFLEKNSHNFEIKNKNSEFLKVYILRQKSV